MDVTEPPFSPDDTLAGRVPGAAPATANSRVPGWLWPGALTMIGWLLGMAGALIWQPLAALGWLGVAAGLALTIRATILSRRTGATAAWHWISFGVAVLVLIPLSVIFFTIGLALVLSQTAG